MSVRLLFNSCAVYSSALVRSRHDCRQENSVCVTLVPSQLRNKLLRDKHAALETLSSTSSQQWCSQRVAKVKGKRQQKGLKGRRNVDVRLRGTGLLRSSLGNGMLERGTQVGVRRSGTTWRIEATPTTAGDVETSGMQYGPVEETVGFNDGSSTRFAPLANGCWTLAGGHGRILESEILKVMEMYARSGLTSFDTADIYGPSESILGAFRERWREEKLQNDDLRDIQVFTKFCPNIFRMTVTPQVVEQTIRRSMAALRAPKLDLVQMHWWDYEVPGMVDVAKSLADLREKGLITSIGTTNMSTEALAQIVDAGVPVVCNQVQFSLLDQRPRGAMLKYCGERNIKLFTYGTLAGGLLSNRYNGEGKKGLFGKVQFTTPDLNTSSLKMYWGIVREAGGQDYWRRLLSTLGGIAASKGASISAVALRWAMQQGPVHPIIGLRNATHLDDNLTALRFSLEPVEIDQIEEVLKTSRGPRGDCYEMERGP